MSPNLYEIRVCDSCGLRYPSQYEQSFGTRCPACMGATRVILSRQLTLEPDPKLSLSQHPPTKPMRAVLLDNIRSAWNVGSIFRSADGFGFDHAYLCGITPTPDGPAHEALTKTSLGAEDMVTWSYHKDAVKLIMGLKKDGWRVYALEEEARAISIQNHVGKMEKSVLILGSEVTGVDPELLDLCDVIYYIPMRGEKKSFNVAIAFSIAAYVMK